MEGEQVVSDEMEIDDAFPNEKILSAAMEKMPWYTDFANYVTMKRDTISNLPCNVLDGILGCLPLKDAVRTSILSKDWRYKWVTRAELDFSGQFLTSFNNSEEAKTIIYQVLRLHQEPLPKFTLYGLNLRNCPNINHWIQFLSEKNVQELTIHIFSCRKYRLPTQLFTFKQLRHLYLDMCFFHPPPNFKGFAKLINLNLERVI
ncbi:hypothetical protein BC332_01068 [Capsicum chinense]|nr:hypothetical protein BC332_01068 [Capsicum chinense]